MGLKARRAYANHLHLWGAQPTWTVIYARTVEVELTKEMNKASRTQYPVKLSMGRTIHKAQGQSYDRGVIDMLSVSEADYAKGKKSRAEAHCHYVNGSRILILSTYT